MTEPQGKQGKTPQPLGCWLSAVEEVAHVYWRIETGRAEAAAAVVLLPDPVDLDSSRLKVDCLENSALETGPQPLILQDRQEEEERAQPLAEMMAA
jgi:hypothetical protein